MVNTERVFLNSESCNSIFQIPSHLVEGYGVNLPSKASLRVDDSGKKWSVSIEKFKDSYFFTNGWKEFAEQVDLKSLDFLKFMHGSSSKQTGMNKERTRKRNGDVNGTASSMPNEKKDKRSRVKTKVIFTKIMKKSNQYRLDIPQSFVSRTGLHKYEKIRLKDVKGREWPVSVMRLRDDYRSMRGGWCDFVIGNKVMIGSTISFTWLSEDMLLTRIVDVGTDNQPLFSTRNNSRWKHLQDLHS